jgi:hypothetical protein
MTQTTQKPSVVSQSPESAEITVYLGGPALIREQRSITLPEGKSVVTLSGLPENLVPNSLTVTKTQGESGKFILGPLSYRPASLSLQAILSKAEGSVITVIDRADAVSERSVTGKLLHIIGNSLVLQVADKVEVLPLGQRYRVDPTALADLTQSASLQMEPRVSKAGTYNVGIMYAAEGLGWNRRFEVFYDASRDVISRFACWVDLTNNTGAPLGETKFKLIAGHNNGYIDQQYRGRKNAHRGVMMAAAAPMGGGALESASFGADNADVEDVGEQKLYVLPDTMALDNGETKQTVLFLAEDVAVKPVYSLPETGYYVQRQGDDSKLPVFVRLKVQNTKANKLGVALPSGSVNVFEPDSSGSLQRTDSSSVGAHVAAGEDFTLVLGTPSRDIKAVRRLVSAKEDPRPPRPVQPTPPATPSVAAATIAPVEEKPAPRYRQEERELVLFNYKDKDVEVEVSEQLPTNELQFIKAIEGVKSFTHNHSNGSIVVAVPKGGSVKVAYAIKFRVE